MVERENAPKTWDVQKLPLEEVGYGKLGSARLVVRFLGALSRLELNEEERVGVEKNLYLAIRLHAGDTRTYEPYINHPVRVALRLIEELDIIDPVIIAAALLHDTVEDHSKELAALLETEIPKSEAKRRKLGARALAFHSSQAVTGLVLEVTNPLPTGQGDTGLYVRHIKKLTETASPQAVVLKFADVRDNTYTARGERPSKRAKLDRKQIGVYALHLTALSRPDSLVPEDKRDGAYAALSAAYQKAKERLGYDSEVSTEENSLRIA